jgi:hypothetical protein
MATVNKDFKVKNGLIVEGTTATVNNFDILTKKQADQDYIVSLIGGTATSANTANTVVKRDADGNFAAGTITASLQGNVTGDVTGTVSDISNHNTDGLSEGTTNKYFTDQRALDATAAAYDAAGSAAQALSDAEDYTDTREGAITTAYQNYADQAEADAIATAAADATTKADAAETAANSYTDDEISSLDLSLKAYADQAEADAVTSANSYTDGRETAITTAYEAYADQAEADAKSYTDTAIGNLVDGAPELLDTLNELAAAIADDENFATTVANSIALKADITYVDEEISGLGTVAQGYADDAEASANSYTDGKITQEVADRNEAISDAIDTEITNRNSAISAAIGQEVIDRDAAITTAVDAIDTDDIEEGASNLYFTNQRAIDAVGGTIGDAINALDTDDIEEGATNLYFTDVRAKTSAAQLLTGATLENITITGDENGLVITAENGVADSTTDELEEGETNLYFTDVRAVDALEAVVPNFTAVELNSVAKQVAAKLEAETLGIQVAYAWNKSEYRSAEFLVKVETETHSEISKVLLTLAGNDNISITEYGIVGTNGSMSSISAVISGTDVQLQVTTTNNNSVVTVMGTLLN